MDKSETWILCSQDQGDRKSSSLFRSREIQARAYFSFMQLGCVPDLSPPRKGDANRAKGPPGITCHELAVPGGVMVALDACAPSPYGMA